MPASLSLKMNCYIFLHPTPLPVQFRSKHKILCPSTLSPETIWSSISCVVDCDLSLLTFLANECFLVFEEEMPGNLIIYWIYIFEVSLSDRIILDSLSLSGTYIWLSESCINWMIGTTTKKRTCKIEQLRWAGCKRGRAASVLVETEKGNSRASGWLLKFPQAPPWALKTTNQKTSCSYMPSSFSESEFSQHMVISGTPTY